MASYETRKEIRQQRIDQRTLEKYGVLTGERRESFRQSENSLYQILDKEMHREECERREYELENGCDHSDHD
jgi:hypothetical protein